MSCPDVETLLRFAQGRTTDAEQALVAEHLDGCDDCRGAIADAARLLYPDAPPDASSDAPLPTLGPGARVSRYEIVEVIGVGGAGVVYRAFDPELQRSIALKLIRPDPSPSRGSSERSSSGRAQARLLQEARAMAQLSHPNVVNVHDVGTYEGHVFMVMEWVAGTTVAEWVHQEKRPWQDVLGVFLEAGRGLAAAHEAGLVHRDFKPENVLIGSDGRPRVTDFGLARPAGARAAAPGGPPVAPEAALGSTGEEKQAPVEAEAVAGRIDLTRLAGTPAYMAPEQFLGQPTDARTDQFSFCVALYLGLYGEHPFGLQGRRDAPLLSMAEPVLAGRVAPAPVGSVVPPALREILLRGLSVAPAERFPSLDALLAELARWRRRPLSARQRAIRIVLVSATACAVGAVAILAVGGPRGGRAWLSALAGRCGNGAVDPGEECDDGNDSNADGCLTTCRFATCGDGKLRALVEECDDGNRHDGDGCSATCLRCRLGKASLSVADNGHCYGLLEAQRSWADARQQCVAAGGDLVTLTSSFEARAVHDALVKGTSLRPWIGLVRLATDDRFGWVTGEPTTAFTQPMTEDSMSGAAACARLASGKLWSGAFLAMHYVPTDCAEPAPALCEQPPWAVHPKDNHAYLVISQTTSWSAARADCTRRGAHLATIGSADEQTFLSAHTFAPVWLGGTDAEQEGTFRWITGEPFRFRGFVSGEPDDWSGRDDCVLMGVDKAWHDRPCGGPYAYVCEVD